MEIKWYGHACFSLDFSGFKVITDPYDETVGYPLPLEEADAVTISHNHFDHNYLEGVPGNPQVLQGPGEKELSGAPGLQITGYHSYHDQDQGEKRGPNTIFKYSTPELEVVHLGDLGAKPAEPVLSALKGVEVLLIPVGGTFTLDAQGAFQLIQVLQPKLVIPMHYKTDALKFNLASVDKFASLFSQVDYINRPCYRVEPSKLNKIQEPSIIVLDYYRK